MTYIYMTYIYMTYILHLPCINLSAKLTFSFSKFSIRCLRSLFSDLSRWKREAEIKYLLKSLYSLFYRLTAAYFCIL